MRSLSADRRRLSGGTYEDGNYEGLDLRGGLAYGSVWTRCSFERCRFGQAAFEGAVFAECRFVACDFTQAKLSGRFRGCWFARCDFSQAEMPAAYITLSQFKRCRFQYANLDRATLDRVDLLDCDFHGANLNLAVSTKLDFSGSSFWGALVPINCAMFSGNRIDREQAHRLLALLLTAEGDWKKEIETLVDPKAKALIARLVNAASGVGEVESNSEDSDHSDGHRPGDEHLDTEMARERLGRGASEGIEAS